MMAVIGGMVVLAAATLLYLASPNQQLMERTMPRKALTWAGSAGLVAGLIFILQWAGAIASAFIVMTLAMLVWTIVPVAAAWRRSARENDQ